MSDATGLEPAVQGRGSKVQGPGSMVSSPALPAEVVLSVRNVSKKFCRNLKRSMTYGIRDLALDLMGIRQSASALRTHEFWALREISFDLMKGESVGIIGLNGSGKSTLLRIINGIFPPDDGEVRVRGRVGGLIALGAGMHPHMTGRENIYLNGVILGMTRPEVAAKMDAIIQFADIGDFLEAPLATYSSGMRVRLGFAAAIHSEPDILLIDEVLAVGDISFVNKSLRYLADCRARAKAILYVSHNLEQIRMLCQRVIILEHGRVVYDGDAEPGIVRYQETARTIRRDEIARTVVYETGAFAGQPQMAPEELELTDFCLLDAQGERVASILPDAALTAVCRFRLKRAVPALFFTFGVLDDKRTPVIWVVSNDDRKFQVSSLAPGSYELRVSIADHHLMPGVYYPNVNIRNQATGETYERMFFREAFVVRSDGRQLERGLIRVTEKWDLKRLGDA